MITFDVRLLVRGDHTADEVLEQLLTGVLRVHAAVELVPDPRLTSVDGQRSNENYGRHVPSAPVHRNPRSATTYAAVRHWYGDRVTGSAT